VIADKAAHRCWRENSFAESGEDPSLDSHKREIAVIAKLQLRSDALFVVNKFNIRQSSALLRILSSSAGEGITKANMIEGWSVMFWSASQNIFLPFAVLRCTRNDEFFSIQWEQHPLGTKWRRSEETFVPLVVLKLPWADAFDKQVHHKRARRHRRCRISWYAGFPIGERSNL